MHRGQAEAQRTLSAEKRISARKTVCETGARLGRCLAGLLFTVMACGLGVARAQQAPAQAPGGAQQFAGFGDFKLRSGEGIRDFRLGYRAVGKLNAERSKTVLWPTGPGGKTE